MNSYIYNFHQGLSRQRAGLKIIYKDKIYQQADILAIVRSLAIYFDSIGIGKNTRVAIVLKNHPYFLFCLYALFYLRAIPISIDSSHAQEVIDELIADELFLVSDKKKYYYKGNFISLSRLIKENKPGKKSGADSEFIKILRKNSYKDAKENSPFIILCSSGTTGLPKKVVLSEKNILWADQEYARLYNFKKNDSLAFIVPAHYSLGILACGIIPFNHKKIILISDGLKIQTALKEISKYKISVLPATPIIYNKMNRCDLACYDFSGLKLCDSGGQILPVAIIKKFAENTGVFITEGYGLTETSSLTHFLVPDRKGELKLGSMGKPCKKVLCKILDEYGKPVGNLIPGELFVKGPQNMLGYDDAAQNSKIFTKDDWLITGDIVYKDNENFYYHVSRKIDLLEHKFKQAKKLREIEEILYGLDCVEECAVLLTKTKNIILFIKPKIKSVNNLELKKYISSSLLAISKDLEIKLVASIPRTSTYKVRRNILRKIYE